MHFKMTMLLKFQLVMSEMNKMVGPVGLEPTTKGFTLSRYFYPEWTISSPTT